MNYRKLGRTGIPVGEVGMGCEGFLEKSDKTVKQFLDIMEANGANCIDLYSPDPVMRSALGKALKGRREKFVLQGHLCTTWKDNQYKRTRKMDEVKAGFEDLLKRLDTDYLDIGMIHYVDSLSQWESIKKGPVMEYAMELKKAGTIKAIGLSSHNPEASLAAVHTGLIDVLMFSVPAMTCSLRMKIWSFSGLKKATKNPLSIWILCEKSFMKPASVSV